MTNKELFAEEIIELAINGIALTKDGKLRNCFKTDCDDCVFKSDDCNCFHKKQEWLNSECEENLE